MREINSRFRFASVLPLSILPAVLVFESANAVPDQCEMPVLTVAEAAGLLRVDTDEIRRLAERQELPARLVGASWRFNCAALMAWLNGDWQLIATAMPAKLDNSFSVPTDAAALPSSALAHVTGAGSASFQADADDQPRTPVGDDGEPIGEAPEELTAEDIFLRSQRVLLGRGDKTFDYGQFFLESNGEPLVSVNGGAALATVEAESLVSSFQGRFGILEETELFFGTSYSNQDSDVFIGNEKIAGSGLSEFGPVRFGARRTLMRERSGRPNIIGTLDTLIPTGDTSYAIGAGLSFVKSVDPVALFASVSYRHTFVDDLVDLARLEPEDRLDASLGFALAVNDTLSLSTAVSAAFTGATRYENAKLRQQDRYSLQFGLTSWLAEGIYIEPNVSYSLGGPNDDFGFGLSVFTFRR